MNNLKPTIPTLADDCLRLLCKATRYDIFVDKLRRALANTFDGNVRVAVYQIIEKLSLKDGVVSDSDIAKIEPLVDKLLGEDLTETVKEDLEKLTKNLYNDSVWVKGQDIASIGVDVNFNLPDKRAIDQLNRANIVWIKGNDLKSQVANDLTSEMVKARELGLTRKQTATLLERQFGPLVPSDVAEKYGTARYWEGFTRQHATRTRVFADLDTYAAAGITKFQNWSRLSERTCETCGRMHGTVYTVKDALKQKETYFAAAQSNDIDGMKKAFPWLYAPPDENDLPKDVRLAPFHYFCECTTKTFREEPGVSDHANGEVNLATAGDKLKYENFGGKQVKDKVAYSVLDPHNRAIEVTEERLQHIISRNKTGHLKFGKPDPGNYKNIPEAIRDYSAIVKDDLDTTYIGNNGYLVVCRDNVVITSFFADYGGNAKVRPKTLNEAIEKAKEHYLQEGYKIYDRIKS